ncbi:MAG TPA: hypothetical protein ENI92_05305, partial [Bacteroidetes bacterium]|nr:hypothetical protein [Bacteroidota bacterium]
MSPSTSSSSSSGRAAGSACPAARGCARSNLLNRITRGEGELGDLDNIERLCHTMEVASLCALGKSAPHPVTSTMKYFHDEYIAHIVDKTCPAG